MFRKQMEANTKKKFYGLWSVEDIIKHRKMDPQIPRDIENQAFALEKFNTLERLHEIKNGTLIFAGSHDRIMPKSAMDLLIK